MANNNNNMPAPPPPSSSTSTREQHHHDDQQDHQLLVTTMVECEECGHRLPEANMSIHRARCHSYQRRDPTIHQEDHRLEEEGCSNDGSIVNEVIEAVDESISGEYVPPPPSSPTNTTQQARASSSSTTSQTVSPAANEWSCPRCTLFNPNTSNTCEACLYQRGGPLQNNNNNNGPRMHVNVTEVDPHAVGRAVGVASWAIIGALVGGPAGALVAGGSAAAISGIQHQLQQHRNANSGNSDNPSDGRQQQQRRPFFAVTTTSYSSTPWGGTTMSVTSNASGQRRTMTIRDVNGNNNNGNNNSMQLRQMSPADQRIVQMLMLNAINQGTATPETANQMTFEELLQRFGFPTDPRQHHQGRPRGATPELIESCSTLETLETKDSVSKLTENQSTCNICLEELKEGDTIRKLNHCSHTFHKECIDEWLSRVPACPICKNELTHHHHHQQQQRNNEGPPSPSSTPTSRTATGSPTSSSQSPSQTQS